MKAKVLGYTASPLGISVEVRIGDLFAHIPLPADEEVTLDMLKTAMKNHIKNMKPFRASTDFIQSIKYQEIELGDDE